MRKEINVHIGEVKVARNGEILKTILGSCVGIAFIWKERKICGLAHCLLAEAPTPSFSITGRFVNQAIPSLIAMMKIRPEHFKEIQVIVAGGGNMTQPGAKNVDKLVGSTNFETAMSVLRKLGIEPIRTDQAQEDGRKMTIDSLSGEFTIEAIPRLKKAE